jgi:hypothetical protein
MGQLDKIGSIRPPRGASGRWGGEDAVFTRFVQGLEPGQGWDGEGCEDVWQALRRLLARELRRRSLWSLSPAYLGIYGCASWAEEEALEELVADAFLFLFGERLRSLKAHLRSKPDIEGLVLRGVRNFLHEAQKRHDPVGFRVFTVLRGAVRAAVAAGALHVVEGSPAVRRSTVLASAAGRSAAEAVPAAVLGQEVRAWNDDLLPDLITAWGWEVRPLMERVEGHLRQLPAKGFDVFRFQDLVDPLRHDVRTRWRALWAGAQGEVVPAGGEEDWAMTHLVLPARRIEERESFLGLLRCLERGIESLKERSRSKEYLRRLEAFLRNYAADTAGMPGEAGERILSHRRLAELLDIPRERLPGLFATLQKLAEACRRRASGRESR